MNRISVFQIIIILALIPAVFFWMPWLSCENLDGLSKYGVELSSVPEGTGCFYVSHGTVGYRDSLPISEKPLPFIGLTVLLLVLFCLLILSFIFSRTKKNDYSQE